MKIGNKAPNFEAKDQNGKLVKLSDFNGKKILLYFYPKDMTPGCTREACNLRDNIQLLKKNNMVVLGVSKDSIDSHNKFIAKHKLPFQLLADTDGKICKAYGVWGKKSFMGRIFDGIKRTSFLIDENGKIKAIFNKVDVDNHADQVLKEINI